MDLSRDRCNIIKGIAILLIMIHNFVDELFKIYSNEMAYSMKTTQAFLDHLFTADAVWYIFAFCGWIGVPLFFFLSGYGLTKKYDGKSALKPGPFIKNHLVKLWLLLVPIYLVYFSIYTTNIQSAITQLTFTNVILSYCNFGISVDPGPYWFFGAILQFYLLFIVFRKMKTRWLWVLCAVFIVFNYCILYCADATTMKWTRYNFLGWGATFILGIIAARNRLDLSKRTNALLCVASLVALSACLVIKWLAPFAEVCTIVFLVTVTRPMKSGWLRFIGVISPSIFALHPLIRMLFYSLFPAGADYPLVTTVVYASIVILASWIHHLVLDKTNQWLKTVGH